MSLFLFEAKPAAAAPVSAKSYTTAQKWQRMANTIGTKIGQLRREGLSNTPKRARQQAANRLEAANLERMRDAYLALAVAYGDGTVPDFAQSVATSDDVRRMVGKSITSTSCYNVCEGEHYRSDPDAVKFRGWVAGTTDRIVGSTEREARAARLSRERIQELEQSVRFADIPGFFPTPKQLAEWVVVLAEVAGAGDVTVLEPSAGKGDLLEAIKAANPQARIVACEINHQLAWICEQKGFKVERGDFLQHESTKPDIVVMNPPFERGSDVKHVLHAAGLMREGGRLVAIVSSTTADEHSRSGTSLRMGLDDLGCTYEVHETDPAAFANGFIPTGVRTAIIKVRKI